MQRTDFAAGSNNPKLGDGGRSDRKVHVYSAVEALSVIWMDHLAHCSQVHWTFLWPQAKDAIGLVGPNDLTCSKVPFPVTHMGDALGFFKSGVALLQLASQRRAFFVGLLTVGNVTQDAHVLEIA